MILRELQQAANTQEIGAAVPDVSDAEFRAVDPRGGHCRAHALLLRMLFRRFKDAFVRQVYGARKPSRSGTQVRLRLAEKWSRWVLLRVDAMLHEGFHRESAGDFTMRFATHSIGEHKKIQRRNDAEAVFVVSAHATYIAHAATHDSHTSSYCRWQSTPRPHLYRAVLFPR